MLIVKQLAGFNIKSFSIYADGDGVLSQDPLLFFSAALFLPAVCMRVYSMWLKHRLDDIATHAQVDPATGAYAAGIAPRRFEMELARCSRTGAPLYVVSLFAEGANNHEAIDELEELIIDSVFDSGHGVVNAFRLAQSRFALSSFDVGLKEIASAPHSFAKTVSTIHPDGRVVGGLPEEFAGVYDSVMGVIPDAA